MRGCAAFSGSGDYCHVSPCSHHFSEHGHTMKITEKKEVDVPYETIVYEKKLVAITDNVNAKKKTR